MYALQDFLSATRHELLTPLAASRLFKRSTEAVRTAVRNGHIQHRCTVALSSKPVRLISVRSAIDYWDKPLDFAEEIRRLRRCGVVINVDYYLYLVLHTTPVIELSPSPFDELHERPEDDSNY